MGMAKFSVSLPPSLASFVENYRKKHGLRSRSQVLEEVIKLLRSRELDSAYRAADAERDRAWESTIADGLADETW